MHASAVDFIVHGTSLGKMSKRALESFSTPRMCAERLVAAHFDIVHGMHQDALHMEMLGGLRTLEQTEQYMQLNLDHWDRYGFGTWLLKTPDTGEVMGRALLRHITLDTIVETEVGYSLLPAYWGYGLATEIATRCLQIARIELSLPSIVGLTLPHNTRSRNVLQKIGLTYERDIIHAALPHVLYRSIHADAGHTG
jgi:RimJ/RimL family protein N-acetyltransferase